MYRLAVILICLTLSSSSFADDCAKESLAQMKADIMLLAKWEAGRQGSSVYRSARLYDEAIREYLISKSLIDKEKWEVK